MLWTRDGIDLWLSPLVSVSHFSIVSVVNGQPVVIHPHRLHPKMADKESIGKYIERERSLFDVLEQDTRSLSSCCWLI